METYKGHKNYATWACILWLKHDHNKVIDRATEILAGHGNNRIDENQTINLVQELFSDGIPYLVDYMGKVQDGPDWEATTPVELHLAHCHGDIYWPEVKKYINDVLDKADKK